MKPEPITPATATEYRGILATLANPENQHGYPLSVWLAHARPIDRTATPAEAEWLLARMMDTYNRRLELGVGVGVGVGV
jgi:hypothetical protein